jgi:hypothetical protein
MVCVLELSVIAAFIFDVRCPSNAAKNSIPFSQEHLWPSVPHHLQLILHKFIHHATFR